MTSVALFHSALGLSPSVRDFGAALASAGHAVSTPDLFDGEIFDSVEAGLRKRDALGMSEVLRRAGEAVAGLPPKTVYAGFSLGARAAALLAVTRPGALGAILLHNAMAPTSLGVEAWPAGLPLQLHYAEHDRWVDAGAVSALTAAVRAAGAPCETFVYAGDGHLFAERAMAEFDERATRAMLDRCLDFIRRVG